jgi:hypothetical protein
MKRISVLWLAALCVAWGGCASTPGNQAFKGNAELQEAYREWRAIDPVHLNGEQQKLLTQFQQDEEYLVDRYGELIQALPWINAKALTIQDEVFLAQIIDQFAELDVRVSAMTAANR